MFCKKLNVCKNLYFFIIDNGNHFVYSVCQYFGVSGICEMRRHLGDWLRGRTFKIRV